MENGNLMDTGSGKTPDPRKLTTDMEKVEYLGSLISPGKEQFMAQARAITEIAVGWTSVTLEVFLRQEFGMRYLTGLRVFISGALMLLWLLGGWLFGAFHGQGVSIAFAVYTGLFFLMSALHIARNWHRLLTGELIHSRSFGRALWEDDLPQPPFGIDKGVVYYCLIEPAVCMICGFFLWFGAKADGGVPILNFLGVGHLGLWIIIAASGLAIKNGLVYRYEFDRMQDLADSMLEAKHYRARVFGDASRKDSAGLNSVVMPTAMQAALTVGAQPAKAIDLDAVIKETLTPAQKSP